MIPDYDDSDLSDDEMLALAEFAFDDADNAEAIPNADDLALRRSAEFDAILQRSQERLETEGGVGSDNVRSRLGL